MPRDLNIINNETYHRKICLKPSCEKMKTVWIRHKEVDATYHIKGMILCAIWKYEIPFIYWYLCYLLMAIYRQRYSEAMQSNIFFKLLHKGVMVLQWISFNLISSQLHIDGLVQERRNSIANALELRLSCTNPSIYSGFKCQGSCLYRASILIFTYGMVSIYFHWITTVFRKIVHEFMY